MPANIDPKTGIHYGVIHESSLMPEAVSDLINNSFDLAYKDALDEFRSDLEKVLSDHGLDILRVDISALEDAFNDRYESYEPRWFYQDDEYEIQFTDLGLYILKSPYVTLASQCSPCCPNAGDLDSAGDAAMPNCMGAPVRCYCLPDEFFKDHKAPYAYRKVGDRS